MKITNSMLNNENKTVLESYFYIISEIEKTIPKSGNYVLNIEFDNTDVIIFIEPLFLVYLLNFYEKLLTKDIYSSRDIRIVLDIQSLDGKVQSYIMIYLTQYIDCNVIELVFDNKLKNKEVYTYSDKKIVLFILKEENNLTLLKKQKYNFLPIIKIANNTFIDNFEFKDYWIRNKDEDRKELISSENRLIFYKSLQLETIERGVYKNKSDKVWNDIFEVYLELTANGSYITNKFKEIFREIVENIQKHTIDNGISSNGYISFYINRYSNLYELNVSDDYQEGFLKKYYKTICLEINEENEDSISFDGYKEMKKDFEDLKYIEILEKIFNLEYILSVQSKRVVKHFGMPLLLKIVTELGKLSKNLFGKNNVNLTIYLNYDEKAFKVDYIDAQSKVSVLEDNSIRGTYIHLSFPKELHLLNPVEDSKIPLNLDVNQYKYVFNKKFELEKQVSKFQLISLSDLKQKKEFPIQDRYIYIDYEEVECSISDFLRDVLRYIYSYAFIYNIKDVLIINFPMEEAIDHLSILFNIEELKSIVNIVFLNKEYPQVLFLGGNSRNEFLQINSILSKTYNYNKRNFINELYDIPEKIDINSNLFYINENNKLSFIPFELFFKTTLTNEYLYIKMLDNFLEKKENHENIHLDLKNGYHIKQFFYLKNIFENSQWINLIAFNLARNIELIIENNSKKEIILIGIEKYSSLILSIVQEILNFKFKINIIDNLKNKKITEQFNQFIKNNQGAHYIFFRPVVFECSDMNQFLKNINTYDFNCVIRLKTNNINLKEWNTLYEKDIESIVLNSKDEQICEKCFPNFLDGKYDVPLYKIDDDKYNIRDLYIDNFIPNITEIEHNINWKNSIYFGHVVRHLNHYLYYIRTIEFLRNNISSIYKKFFEYIGIHNKDMIPIILSPNHNTNSEFITLINKVIFNNNAIVHTFSLDFKEQVFYNLENLKSLYTGTEKYYEFYFIDDEVASGDTLAYFSNILKQITNQKEIKFNAVFTLIDRIPVRDRENLFSNYFEKFYSYIKLNINPIKTGFEKCYLCERELELKEIADNASLVFIKHAFTKKICSNKLSEGILKKKNSIDIELETIDVIVDFKNYLKMYSTEFIYENLTNSLTIEKMLIEFKGEVYKYFKLYYLNSAEITTEVGKILDFEIKIAFIKSLSFPKVLLFKNIRKEIHKYIHAELYKFIINVENIDENFVVPLLSSQDFNVLNKLSNIDEIVNYYQEKDITNIDYFNFLLSTASYLGINFIMTKEMIEFYFKLTQIIKDENKQYKQYKKYLGIYPIAIKQITNYSKEKSKFFYEQLEIFYIKNKFVYTRQFSRIFGLYIENTKFLESTKKELSEEIQNKLSLGDIPLVIKKDLEEFIKSEDSFGAKYEPSNINIKSFFISINQDVKKPKLIDIFDNYVEVDGNSYVVELFKGAHIKDEISFHDEIDIKHNENKDSYNIWCNFLKKDKTFVRLTYNDFYPFCVIEVEHINIEELSKSEILLIHLKITRRILAKQNEIIRIFKENELISSIRNNYEVKILNDQELAKSLEKQKILENYFKNHGHGVGKLIGFKKILNRQITAEINDLMKQDEYIKEDLWSLQYKVECVKNYAYGLPHIVKAAHLGVDNLEVNTYSLDFFKVVEEMKENIILFLENAHIESHAKINETNYEIIINKPNKKVYIKGINNEELESIIFEFCNNAGKHNMLEKDDKCVIAFSFENGEIIVQNNKKEESSNSGTQVGLNTIKIFFNKKDYKMITINEENLFKIKINLGENV